MQRQGQLRSPRASQPLSPESSDGGAMGNWRGLKGALHHVLWRQGSLVPDLPQVAREWSAESSKVLYNTHGWGAPYFSINEEGHLTVSPSGDEREVDVFKLVQALHERGLRTPVLLRFLDIVGDRIRHLNQAFHTAIERFEYKGAYRGVFPVKCNHDKDLIRSIIKHGEKYGFGLEAGSKAELAMVMSVLAPHPGSILVCNGIKDAEYMELVLHCRELGINAFVVLEQYGELATLLAVSERLGVRPAIGLRAKLTTQHKGHWGSTSGDKAKFGLRAREVVAVVNQLADADMLDCLQLLHFHSGSQITSIREVKEVMRESTYLYAELVKMGAGMKYLDVGGGLAVDYDGSFTDTPASMSYTIQNYANDVVSATQEVCIQRGIEPPTIISESGRALASAHTVLVFDVMSKPHGIRETEKREEEAELMERVASANLDDTAASAAVRAAARPPTLTRAWGRAAKDGKGAFLMSTFKEVFDSIKPDDSSLREAFTDATYFKDEALRAFKLGVLGLEERAAIETMHDATCERIRAVAEAHNLPLPDALRPTSIPGPKQLYHVNMSVFRSSVDVWGISQLFPLMPIHRLEEEPTIMATLADLTCDSDGKVDRFINPAVRGRPPFIVEHVVRGETVAEVLSRAHHHQPDMVKAVRRAADAAVAAGGLGADAAARLLETYSKRLTGYTYMEARGSF
ncbi:arginine decarboxylase [Raphidocelis subcapitata]|uniref:Arginine decarboxylase n=1 Tax=Raphidocelis subcapitata TaxID=307507 RepID=A0A2V0NUY2_9CHLO|nr:arginine decarboxylase [Raphidocelis subcapitata]|eukprot:GBF89380.1 arginine decarboxylase [Raphidocelis subcapitata]